MKQAFLVIVEYEDETNAPVIGDISWSIRDDVFRWGVDWKVHTTEASAAMLAHHGVPYGAVTEEP